MGLATLFGKARGFFIPYHHAASVTPTDYPALAARFEAGLGRFDDLLAQFERLAPRLRALGGPPPAPRFDQSWFPPLDAAIAYALVCRIRPRRIVEVGSGHSTRFLARAIADEALGTSLTCIDPAPRATLDGLPIRWHRCVVQRAPEECFAELAAGDILLVDSSHVLMPGSDVDRLLNRVLPDLATGVVVHFHDVFLPDPYPTPWAWRGYNEQQALAALLQGGAWQILFASHFVATRRAAELATGVLGQLPQPAEPAHPSSLWLVKRG